MIILICILAAIVQPLALLATNQIDRRQFWGIFALYLSVLLIAAAADMS